MSNHFTPCADDAPTGLSPPFRVRFSTPTVPGYEIDRELGRGGMGVVYKARQCTLKRPVALKVILPGVHPDSAAHTRFRTEAQAAARLQHPNIVQIYEVGEFDGRLFLSLEYIEGGKHLGMLAGTMQPERESAQLMETLARAVHYMHQRGILHRDLKPTNVLLHIDKETRRQGDRETDEGPVSLSPPLLVSLSSAVPKIADFGLAKLLDADLGPTRSHTFLGTPSYTAPEQAMGDARNVGTAADVYSLGAILYELLTGQPPFQGATVLGVLEQVRSREPIPPRRLRPSLSVELETICLKCLEKEPDRRYPSARALAEDLRRFLDDLPIQAKPAPCWRRLWKSVRRQPARVARFLAATSLICLVLVVAAGWRLANQRARQQAEDRYQKFVECRDTALVHGLLAPEEGGLFLGTGAAHQETAESAAREALALAGVQIGSGATVFAPGFPAARRDEAARDCYTLLLLLAGITGNERRREALAILDRAGQLGFQTRTYHLRRAYFLDAEGEQQAARKEKERAAVLPLEDALDHFLAGEEHYRRGEWTQARDSFNHALSRQPDHFWAQFFLAVCHLKTRNPEAAKAGLNACLAQRPGFVWAYLFRSFANEKLSSPAEVEADFQKALELGPGADARYVLYLTRGVLRFKQRELSQAAADFRSAMALKPEQYNAHVNLAQVHLLQGDFDQAEQQFRTALRLGPPAQVVAGYHLERGRGLLREKRYEEAVQECNRALALVPQHPLPHEVLGRSLLALERAGPAEQAFEQYLQKGGPEKSDILRGRGQARMKLGKYPQAAEDYTQALKLAADADLYEHRGWAHFFSDAWKLALLDFSRAIELAPPAPDARIGRGLALVHLGRYREAVTDAEAGLLGKPRSPEMMHNIACIFAQASVHAQADLQQKDRHTLADDYRRQALGAVRRTLAMLPPKERPAFWRDKIQPDTALAPLREDAEFKRLQAE
jgi:serine/threonine-protein kinase